MVDRPTDATDKGKRGFSWWEYILGNRLTRSVFNKLSRERLPEREKVKMSV